MSGLEITGTALDWDIFKQLDEAQDDELMRMRKGLYNEESPDERTDNGENDNEGKEDEERNDEGMTDAGLGSEED